MPQYRQRLQQLVEAVQQLSLARDLDAIADIVRHTARHLTGADGATFVLRDGDKCFYKDEDAISPLWKGQRFPLEICISGWAMLNRQPAVIPDIYADPRIPHAAYRPTFVKSLVMVPIRTLDPVGSIGNYWASEHHASEEEVDLLRTLADSTAVAMENVRVYTELEQRVVARTAQLAETNALLRAEIEERERAQREIQRISHTNLLTGLLNRRGFFAGAEAQFERARREGARCMVAFIDLDGLKRRNDEYGHASGDRMIVDAAQVLQRAFGDGELVARVGGDEFVVWSVGGADAAVASARLRAALDAFNRETGVERHLSMSVGVIEAPASEFDDLDHMLARADAAMYADKQDRRRCA